VIALAPENVWGYNNLAVLYFTLGRYAEARKMFERAVSLRPSYSFYSNLGTLAFIQRNWAEAVARFEQARALDDKDYVLWGNLGIAYHWLGEHEQQSRAALTKAIALTEQQLAVNPRDTAVLADLAGYHTLLGEKDKALSYLRRSRPTAARARISRFRLPTSTTTWASRIRQSHGSGRDWTLVSRRSSCPTCPPLTPWSRTHGYRRCCGLTARRRLNRGGDGRARRVLGRAELDLRRLSLHRPPLPWADPSGGVLIGD